MNLKGGHISPVGLAGLVSDGARTLRVVSEGHRRRGSPEPVAPGDLWHIGSNTKAMTAALYARLVEQGGGRLGRCAR
jgi:CubicO group peptidase (beta-lactamase class C family)